MNVPPDAESVFYRDLLRVGVSHPIIQSNFAALFRDRATKCDDDGLSIAYDGYLEVPRRGDDHRGLKPQARAVFLLVSSSS